MFVDMRSSNLPWCAPFQISFRLEANGNPYDAVIIATERRLPKYKPFSGRLVLKTNPEKKHPYGAVPYALLFSSYYLLLLAPMLTDPLLGTEFPKKSRPPMSH